MFNNGLLLLIDDIHTPSLDIVRTFEMNIKCLFKMKLVFVLKSHFCARRAKNAPNSDFQP